MGERCFFFFRGLRLPTCFSVPDLYESPDSGTGPFPVLRSPAVASSGTRAPALCWELREKKRKGKVKRLRPGSGKTSPRSAPRRGLSCLKRSVEKRGERRRWKERERERERERPFSSSFLLRLWSCSLIWVGCVHSVIRRSKEEGKEKKKHQTNRQGENVGWGDDWRTVTASGQRGAGEGKSGFVPLVCKKKKKKPPSHSLINICRYTNGTYTGRTQNMKLPPFWLKVSSRFSANRIVSSSYLTLLVWSNAFYLIIILTGPKCLFPFSQGMKCTFLLESFQLSCVRDCDERNQRHVKICSRVALIYLFFCLSEIILYQDVLRFFFCMHFNSRFLVLSGYSISTRAVISPTTIPFPFVHVLNHGWMHLFFFLWKRFFFWFVVVVTR